MCLRMCHNSALWELIQWDLQYQSLSLSKLQPDYTHRFSTILPGASLFQKLKHAKKFERRSVSNDTWVYRTETLK